MASQKKIFLGGGGPPPPGAGYTQGWVPIFPMFNILGVYLYIFCIEMYIYYVYFYREVLLYIVRPNVQESNPGYYEVWGVNLTSHKYILSLVTKAQHYYIYFY